MYIISEDDGDIDDFMDGVGASLDREIDLIDVILLSHGQTFIHQDWKNRSFYPEDWEDQLRDKSYYSTETYYLEL